MSDAENTAYKLTPLSPPRRSLPMYDAMVEKLARALALDLCPDSRWPCDESDVDSETDESEGRFVTWHFANLCRSEARFAVDAIFSPSIRDLPASISPKQRFNDWLELGPKLAKEAGIFLGTITVSHRPSETEISTDAK